MPSSAYRVCVAPDGSYHTQHSHRSQHSPHPRRRSNSRHSHRSNSTCRSQSRHSRRTESVYVSDGASMRSEALAMRSNALSARSASLAPPATSVEQQRAAAARADAAYRIRKQAAHLARSRPHPTHRANCDMTRYQYGKHDPYAGHYSYIAAFTKGLPHDPDTGVVYSPTSYALFLHAIANPSLANIRRIPIGPPKPSTWYSGIARNPSAPVRAWESLGAGMTFSLEGPDAQAVTMPPAPELRSKEMAAEMTELYLMALLRDVPFAHLSRAGRRHAKYCVRGSRRRWGAWSSAVDGAVEMWNATAWARVSSRTLTREERKRRRKTVDEQTVFRGITRGDEVGPYVSQFLLVGTKGLGGTHHVKDGYVQYGAMRMDQRVRVAKEGRDYMTTWAAFLDVQNGADLRGRDVWAEESQYRFIATPRDLATYVHHDSLYQAYLNACIILLDIKAPFDAGVPFQAADEVDKQQGFVTFGGPHILSLVAEVATRALKAVRFQKYNTHRRLRPEAAAGLVDRYSGDRSHGVLAGVGPLFEQLDKRLLARIAEQNAEQNASLEDGGVPRRRDLKIEGNTTASLLLPMAFPEGSPMHPSYGAGHAAVSGACATVLKAFFECGYDLPFAYVASEDGRVLEKAPHLDEKLSVEGEVNKLCSNISVGRGWAGVHYFSDYYESILLGEKVALGILEEQKLLFSEAFSMTVPLFDGSIHMV